jgi:outer membrane lipoprotein-sorting protein
MEVAMNSNRSLRIIALCFAVLFPVHRALGDEAEGILAKMQKAVEPGKDMRATFEMSLTNRLGQTAPWTGEYYRKGNKKRVVFLAPVDVKGLDLIIERKPDGANLFKFYLPALRRLRTIEGDMRGEPFFGTDFNFEDLGFEQLTYTKHKILGEDTVGGRACYKIESVPGKSWWYGRIIRCVDKEDYLPRRTQYYALNGELFKERTFDKVDTVQSYPTPVEITMRTVPAKTQSRLRFGDVKYDTNFADELCGVPKQYGQ